MKRLTFSLAVFMLLLSVTVRAADATKPDLDKLQGTWKVTTAKRGADGRLIVEGEKFTLKSPDGSRTGRLKLDATKKPKHIDFIFDAGRRTIGIYELSGDTLKTCTIPDTDGDRPEELKKEPGSATQLNVFKKEPTKK